MLIARQDRASRTTVCGYLVDVHRLGARNATGPLHMGSGSLTAYSHDYFSVFDGVSARHPIELALHVVHGAVAYARGLGFEPGPDFAATAR